ncbi:hypothetical protein [Streptomyces sp. TRM64462]|uniref:hypothetical protein n=1 Tax=Streptomyces sp. TRM64462 TaxID=2741726 RepID=UPI0015860418|nr:hypothetical protein [Streptomyces sp. TRM64462]
MIKKALACAALVAAATALGIAPAAANDDVGGSFGAGEHAATHFHYLQSAGGAVIASGGASEGSAMHASW